MLLIRYHRIDAKAMHQVVSPFCRRPEGVGVGDADVVAGLDVDGGSDADGRVGAEAPVRVRDAVVLQQTSRRIDGL